MQRTLAAGLILMLLAACEGPEGPQGPTVDITALQAEVATLQATVDSLLASPEELLLNNEVRIEPEYYWYDRNNFHFIDFNYTWHLTSAAHTKTGIRVIGGYTITFEDSFFLSLNVDRLVFIDALDIQVAEYEVYDYSILQDEPIKLKGNFAFEVGNIEIAHSITKMEPWASDGEKSIRPVTDD
jgi:hypothetical protein